MVDKPTAFTPEGAPAGVEYRHVEFSRPKLVAPARLLLIHTNAARGEGSIQSAWNWAHRESGNTCPTYQVDRSGNARKMLRSDEDAICNCTVDSHQGSHGDVSGWSLAIETADTGTDDDPTISAFTDAQVETIAQIVAYEHLVPGNDIPLVTPTAWYGSGVAGHTDPFPYPYWTCVTGKICPGSKKKAQIRNAILPRAREIVAEWRGDLTPQPDPNPPVVVQPPIPPQEAGDLYMHHLALAEITDAPPVDKFEGGHVSEWWQKAMFRVLLFALTGSQEYNQAAANTIDGLLAGDVEVLRARLRQVLGPQ